jgi:hypothetical protein
VGSLLILLPPLLFFMYTVMQSKTSDNARGLPEKWRDNLSFGEKLAAAVVITVGVIAALLPWVAGYVGGPMGVFFGNKLVSTLFIGIGSGLAGLTTLLHMNALTLRSFLDKRKEGISGEKAEEGGLPSENVEESELSAPGHSLARILWNQLQNMPFSAKLLLAFFVLLPVLPWPVGFVGGLASHGFIATLTQFAAKPAFAGLSISVQAVWLFATVAAAVSALTVFFGFAVLTQSAVLKPQARKDSAHGQDSGYPRLRACWESVKRVFSRAPANELENTSTLGSVGIPPGQSTFGGGRRGGGAEKGGSSWLDCCPWRRGKSESSENFGAHQQGSNSVWKPQHIGGPDPTYDYGDGDGETYGAY